MVVDDPKQSSNSIHQFVMAHIPEAELTRIHGKELDITLPLASVDKFAGEVICQKTTCTMLFMTVEQY